MEELGGVTTLILKLTRKLSYEELLTALHNMCFEAVPELGPAAFDFAHLPWKKLAVVNFISPETCARCSAVLLSSRAKGAKGGNTKGGRPFIVDLKTAEHQGELSQRVHKAGCS
eukprot:Skav226637  [mRNA]  locus=scaffold1450:33618:40115:+ [translate_table: standard]